MKRNGASASDDWKRRKGMARVYWGMMECRERFTHRLFTDEFTVKSEVKRTGSDGLPLIQYHPIMAGRSEFANVSLTLFIRVVHRNHFTLHRQIVR